MIKKTVIIGAALVVIGIILGAFGAHALKEVLSQEKLSSFETGVRYEIYHGLALMLIGLNQDKLRIKTSIVVNLLLIGVLLFSFSIYLLALQETFAVNLKFLGPITPLGGVLMISGWLVLIVQLFRRKD